MSRSLTNDKKILTIIFNERIISIFTYKHTFLRKRSVKKYKCLLL